MVVLSYIPQRLFEQICVGPVHRNRRSALHSAHRHFHGRLLLLQLYKSHLTDELGYTT